MTKNKNKKKTKTKTDAWSAVPGLLRVPNAAPGRGAGWRGRLYVQ
jgi:hypothetical protein